MTIREWLACALTLVVAAPPLPAQVDSMVRLRIHAERSDAIERTMRAFVDHGLTVTEVERAGLVKAVGHEKGDVRVTYTAAVLPDVANASITVITLSAFARYQPAGEAVNPLGAQVTTKTKGGAGVWARLQSIAKTLRTAPPSKPATPQR
ncbi:MAG TPA: hypothetical protein VFM14_12265 [Gemmatimonadales bacterium]|nr:hypothetical protein [Gemmatimonadales bacterium]